MTPVAIATEHAAIPVPAARTRHARLHADRERVKADKARLTAARAAHDDAAIRAEQATLRADMAAWHADRERDTVQPETSLAH